MSLFPRLSRRKGRPNERSVDLKKVIWGVRRRAGFSELDDPTAHRGQTKHAFVLGNDTVAWCGYRPYRWRQRRAVPLAAATPDNPDCLVCVSAIWAAVALGDPAADTLASSPPAPVPGIMVPVLIGIDEPSIADLRQAPTKSRRKRARPPKARRTRPPVAA